MIPNATKCVAPDDLGTWGRGGGGGLSKDGATALEGNTAVWQEVMQRCEVHVVSHDLQGRRSRRCPLVNIADLTRLMQQVMRQMNPMGVAQQVAEEAARRVSSHNDARWQEMQAEMSAIESGPVAFGGPDSTAPVGRYAPTMGRGPT